MSYPGMPPIGGGAAGGMSEQEQATVKMVCSTASIDALLPLTSQSDASRHGIVSDQINHGRWDGLRTRRCIRPFHV